MQEKDKLEAWLHSYIPLAAETISNVSNPQFPQQYDGSDECSKFTEHSDTFTTTSFISSSNFKEAELKFPQHTIKGNNPRLKLR